ncbi:MAG: 30S ribosomal protein S12 [Candidatus Aenigmarchaeota archaeon]|nr:30S ribosomal protein S12 [Candidatus Aenigmarchaeota archaeon]
MGEFNGRKMKKQRMQKKWKKTKYKVRVLKLIERKDPLQGSPQAKGIVIKKTGVEQKQPHSGIIKVVRVQLLKNGKEVSAFCPRSGAINVINEHDEVIIEGLGGSQRGPIGSMPGIKYRVSKVNGIPLEALRTGKAKKGAR